MQCYHVQHKESGSERYAGTMATATAARNEIVEQQDCKKKEITIDKIDIPTAKSDLLEFINTLIDTDK